MHLAIMVETRWRDDTAIARCRGPVLFGPTSRHLRTSVGRLILRHRRVILHLGGVTRFDACGVGTLAALIRLAQWSGGRLLLATPSDRVRYLLVLTRLDTQLIGLVRVWLKRAWIAVCGKARYFNGRLWQHAEHGNVQENLQHRLTLHITTGRAKRHKEFAVLQDQRWARRQTWALTRSHSTGMPLNRP